MMMAFQMTPRLAALNSPCVVYVYNCKFRNFVTGVTDAKIMAVRRSKMKNFDNPYSDYTEQTAEGLITGMQIHKYAKIKMDLEAKWERINETFNKNLKKDDTTVYTGTSGVALLYLLRDSKDVDNLKKVKDLLQTNAIMSKRRLTFLCGDGGPLAIGAVVAHKLGDQTECKSLVKTLLSLKTNAVTHKSDMPNEYLYGRAGYLYALLYVNKYITPPPVDESIIKSIIEAILKSGQKLAKEGNFKSPLMYEWHDSYYMGAAHGVSGIVYLLLQVKEYLSEEQLQKLIKPTIDYLASLQFPTGNYPSSLESQSGDKYVQWCHGAPGFVFMFSEAYKVFKDAQYLQLAEKASDIVWERGLLRKGYSICHGVSGNAYCFLEMFQTTKEVKHLYRAVKFAEWCLNYSSKYEEHSPDRPLSLFEGIAGPMYLLIDIQNPMNAKFPGYTL